MTEFKIGDRVRRYKGGSQDGMREGETGVITSFDTDGDIRLVLDKNGATSYWHEKENLELVKKGSKAKIIPEVLHLVLQDSCKNIIGGVKRSFVDAKKERPSDSEVYTIYKLVPIAKIENKIVISKIVAKIRKKLKKKK